MIAAGRDDDPLPDARRVAAEVAAGQDVVSQRLQELPFVMSVSYCCSCCSWVLYGVQLLLVWWLCCEPVLSLSLCYLAVVGRVAVSQLALCISEGQPGQVRGCILLFTQRNEDPLKG
ncbi:unnamed protein product [Ectocarpus sp. 12 AP-2014]